MKWMSLLLLFALLAAADGGVPSPAADIAAANRHYITVLRAGRPADIALDYEADGEFLSPQVHVRGRTQLAKFFARRMRGLRLESGACTTQLISVRDETAFELGTCDVAVRRAGRELKRHGSYVTFWAYHRAERRWLIRSNVVPQ